MDYPLANLEALFRLVTADPSHASFAWADEVERQLIIAERSVRNGTLAIQHDSHLNRYLSTHIEVCVSMMDVISSFRKQSCLERVFVQLEAFYNFLAGQLTDPECSDKAVVPLTWINELVKEIETVTEKWPPELRHHSMVMKPLLRFTEAGPKGRFTRRDIDYSRRYLLELEQWQEGILNVDELPVFLLRRNLNTFESLQCIVTYLSTAIGQLDEAGDRLKLLSEIRHYCIPGMIDPAPYDEHRPSVREVIVDWISFQAHAIVQRGGALTEVVYSKNSPGSVESKLLLNLSVAQLACITRMMMDSGILVCDNVSEVIRFICRNIRSKRSGNISPESFRAKYYNIEDNTRDSIEEIVGALAGVRRYA